MDGLHFSTFLPGIWVCYIQSHKKATNCEITLKKFCKIHSIKNVIRLDKDVNYWLQSRNYEPQIKQQIISNEIKKLTLYYKDKTTLIYNNYFNNTNTLIISNKNIEITAGLLLNFLTSKSKQSLDNAIMSLKSIFIEPIYLSEEMKRLISLYNISNIL